MVFKASTLVACTYGGIAYVVAHVAHVELSVGYTRNYRLQIVFKSSTLVACTCGGIAYVVAHVKHGEMSVRSSPTLEVKEGEGACTCGGIAFMVAHVAHEELSVMSCWWI